MKLETCFFGVEAFSHPRGEGGPRVWTILVRLGRKMQLFPEASTRSEG